MKHDIGYYSDGNRKVAFCRVCGVEGDDLYSAECPGEYQPWPKSAADLEQTMKDIENYPIKFVDK
jgi:hypothetical protein